MEQKQTPSCIAYRCPQCGEAVYGLTGKFALSAGMLRLKCHCGGSTLDMTVTPEKSIRLSVPCPLCRRNHDFTVSSSLFFGRDRFSLACPYANMDIAHLGGQEQVDAAVAESGQQLERLIRSFDGEELRDIQPQDMADEEILPDASVYDCLRFLLKELEAEGEVHCHCPAGEGEYDLRFTDRGSVQAYCTRCGASHDFAAESPAAVEDYLTLDTLTLQ